ncbi:MAG: CvpA family protein [Planctomycetota bacterium]
MLILLAASGLFAYSTHQDVLVGRIAAPLLALGALHGLWRGGFRKAAMLVATILVFYCVTKYGGAAAQLAQNATGSASAGWGYAGLSLVAVITLVFTSLVVNVIRRRHILKRPLVTGLDRLSGTFVGAAEAALIVLAVCWTAVEIRPHAMLVRDYTDTPISSSRQEFAAGIVRLADEVGVGTMGRIVDATNPIDHIPVLRKAIDDLNRTGQFDLGSLDPETARKLNELLKQTPSGDAGGLQGVMEQLEHKNETAEQLRQELPQPGQAGR